MSITQKIHITNNKSIRKKRENIKNLNNMEKKGIML